MFAKLKKLLQMLMTPEVVALIRMMRMPIKELIDEHIFLTELLEEREQHYAATRKYQKELELADAIIKRYRQWDGDMKFHFFCSKCRDYFTEPCPPEMRLQYGGNVCTPCAMKTPHPKSSGQIVKLRSTDELFNSLGFAY
jgi:hypothetical protein